MCAHARTWFKHCCIYIRVWIYVNRLIYIHTNMHDLTSTSKWTQLNTLHSQYQKVCIYTCVYIYTYMHVHWQANAHLTICREVLKRSRKHDRLMLAGAGWSAPYYNVDLGAWVMVLFWHTLNNWSTYRVI